MESAEQLAHRFREVILNGTWIANTNYVKAISGVTRSEAIAKKGDHNSIAALTFHVNYYISGVLNVLNGGELEIRDKYSFDMPPVSSEADWDRLRSELKENATKFANKVEELDIDQLEQAFVDPKYGSYRRNIEGLIEHAYYHLGQISLLRKLL